MLNAAIVFTRENASIIADSLIEYTAQELLDEYDYMLSNPDIKTVVLGRNTMSDGISMVSYVVTGRSFRENNPGIELNDHTFTTVYEI
jgi:hypothetical protein